MYSIILFITLIANFIGSGLTCMGYKTKVTHIENCGGPDQVVKIEDGFNLKLNKKCELIPEGCISYKGFETATSKWEIYKDGEKIKENAVNLCEASINADPEQRKMMRVFSMPENCPIKEGRFCGNGQKVDISKYKHMLAMLRGNYFINETIVHDNNRVSCFALNVEVNK